MLKTAGALVRSMPTTAAEKAYLNALPVWEAVLRCGPAELVSQFLTIQDAVVPTSVLDVCGRSTNISEHQNDPVSNYQIWQAMRDGLRQCAYEMLENGDLLAIGYSTNPLHPQAKPEWIAAALWRKRTYSWEAAELVGENGTLYRSIKVVAEPSAYANWTNRSFTTFKSYITNRGVKFPIVKIRIGRLPTGATPARSVQRRVGGPTQADVIIVAYIKASNEGKIDFTTSLRANLPAIVSAAREAIDPRTNEKVRGLGYEAVRRAVGSRFSKEKLARHMRGSE